MYSPSLSSLSFFGAFVVFFLSSKGSTEMNSGVCVTCVSAFSSSGIISLSQKATYAKQQKKVDMIAVLAVSTTTRRATGVAEEDAQYILNKAREFAFEDDDDYYESIEHNEKEGQGQGGTSSGHAEYDKHYHPLSDERDQIKESKFWLQEIVHLQSGCVAGTLVGKDLCENQDVAAEIVARLRYKIDWHERRVAKRTKGSDSNVPMIATELSVGALLVVFGIFWTTLDLGQRHDDLTAMNNFQEWVGILKEKGYFASMIERYF